MVPADDSTAEDGAATGSPADGTVLRSWLGAAGWSAVWLVLGLTVTAVAARSLEAGIDADAEERFVQSADQTAQALEREVAGYFEELTDIGAYLTSRQVSTPAPAGEFDVFVRATGIFDGLPSIVGVIVLDLVAPDELTTFFDRMAAAQPDFAPFVIGETPPGRPHLVLSYYVAGSVDLQFPVGTDVSPIVSISEGIEVAGRQGTGLAGSFQDDPLLLAIARETDFPAIEQLLSVDFFLGVPVYAVDDQRPPGARDAVAWVAAPVSNFDSVLGAAAEGQPAQLGLELRIDWTTDDGPGGVDLSRAAERPGTAGPSADARHRADYVFDVVGVPWSLHVWSAESPDRLPVLLAWVSGTVAAALAALLAHGRVRNRERERAYVRMLAERDEFRRAILDSVAEPVVVVDARGALVEGNPAWRALCGPVPPQGIGPDGPEGGSPAAGTYLEVLAELARGDLDDLRDGLARILAPDGAARAGTQRTSDDAPILQLDVALARGHGERWFTIRGTSLRGARGGAVLVHTDITERKRSEDELQRQATHDDLTGLLNRAAMDREIERALGRAALGGRQLALLFLDLDGFKPINDTHGHAVGDEVLEVVAQRVAGAVRASDRVGRVGGDEFVVLVDDIAGPSVAEATAQRVLGALRAPVDVGGTVLDIAASIGVALSNPGGQTAPDRLLAGADRAMYAAKRAGGDRYLVEELSSDG
jgi:diguanylate cyclase (GGDEF)-like protein